MVWTRGRVTAKQLLPLHRDVVESKIFSKSMFQSHPYFLRRLNEYFAAYAAPNKQIFGVRQAVEINS